MARSRQGRALWSINHSVFGVCFLRSPRTPNMNELRSKQLPTFVWVVRDVFTFLIRKYFFGAVPRRLMCLSSLWPWWHHFSDFFLRLRDLLNRNYQYNEEHRVVKGSGWHSGDDEPHNSANRRVRQRNRLGERLISGHGDLIAVPHGLLEHHLLG